MGSQILLQWRELIYMIKIRQPSITWGVTPGMATEERKLSVPQNSGQLTRESHTLRLGGPGTRDSGKEHRPARSGLESDPQAEGRA